MKNRAVKKDKYPVKNNLAESQAKWVAVAEIVRDAIEKVLADTVEGIEKRPDAVKRLSEVIGLSRDAMTMHSWALCFAAFVGRDGLSSNEVFPCAGSTSTASGGPPATGGR